MTEDMYLYHISNEEIYMTSSAHHSMMTGSLSAKSYVQNGLVGMWDGIENAGFGQHSENLTVWKNLGSNGSIHDASRISNSRATAWAANGAVCVQNDASYQFIIPGRLMTDVMKGEWSYELVFTPGSQWMNGQWSGIFGNHGGGLGPVGGQNSPSAHNVEFVLYYPPTALCILNYSSFSVGTCTCVSQAASNTSHSATTWKDGSVVSSVTGVDVLLTHLGNDNTGNTCIGSSYNQGQAENGRTFDGTIHCVRVYNRPITSGEVAKNHVIDLKRFYGNAA